MTGGGVSVVNMGLFLHDVKDGVGTDVERGVLPDALALAVEGGLFHLDEVLEGAGLDDSCDFKVVGQDNSVSRRPFQLLGCRMGNDGGLH